MLGLGTQFSCATSTRCKMSVMYDFTGKFILPTAPFSLLVGRSLEQIQVDGR